MYKLCLVVAGTILCPAAALAVDGVTLINQATVQATGGFPYRITQPGSYKLSGNLVSNGKSAIIITAAFVTLDLGGFTISCTACSGVAGIVSSSVYTTIQNGSVTGFVGPGGRPYGIYFQAADGKVEHVSVVNNDSGIVSDPGVDITVSNSLALNNFTNGIAGGGILTVINCKVSGNGWVGIVIDTGLVFGSTISGNGGAAGGYSLFGGIQVTHSASITNNVIANNGAANSGFGIFTHVGPSITGVGMNTFFGNGYNGIANMSGIIKSLGNNMCGSGNVC